MASVSIRPNRIQAEVPLPYETRFNELINIAVFSFRRWIASASPHRRISIPDPAFGTSKRSEPSAGGGNQSCSPAEHRPPGSAESSLGTVAMAGKRFGCQQITGFVGAGLQVGAMSPTGAHRMCSGSRPASELEDHDRAPRARAGVATDRPCSVSSGRAALRYRMEERREPSRILARLRLQYRTRQKREIDES